MTLDYQRQYGRRAAPAALPATGVTLLRTATGGVVLDMEGDLRARCEQRVHVLEREVGIPDPWDMNTFLDRLEVHRGREIDLCALRWTAGENSGAWRAYPDHDVIAYSENTSPVHQDAIILHEIGHMIANHRGRCVLSEEEAHRRAPDLGAAAFVHMLERVNAAAEEREAELTARFVIARIARQRSRRRHRSPLASRVEAVFG